MKSKVLLIDDSVTIHRVIDLSIDFDRYDIVKVFSKEDAALKLQSEQFDYILLDNKLDNIIISEYISELKQQQKNATIILLVGAFDRFDETDLDKTKADDYLVKPFDSQSLNEKLSSDVDMMPAGIVERIAEADFARDNDDFIQKSSAVVQESGDVITKEEYLENLEEVQLDDLTDKGYVEDLDQTEQSSKSVEENQVEEAVEQPLVIDDAPAAVPNVEPLDEAIMEAPVTDDSTLTAVNNMVSLNDLEEDEDHEDDGSHIAEDDLPLSSIDLDEPLSVSKSNDLLEVEQNNEEEVALPAIDTQDDDKVEEPTNIDFGTAEENTVEEISVDMGEETHDLPLTAEPALEEDTALSVDLPVTNVSDEAVSNDAIEMPDPMAAVHSPILPDIDDAATISDDYLMQENLAPADNNGEDMLQEFPDFPDIDDTSTDEMQDLIETAPATEENAEETTEVPNIDFGSSDEAEDIVAVDMPVEEDAPVADDLLSIQDENSTEAPVDLGGDLFGEENDEPAADNSDDLTVPVAEPSEEKPLFEDDDWLSDAPAKADDTTSADTLDDMMLISTNEAESEASAEIPDLDFGVSENTEEENQISIDMPSVEESEDEPLVMPEITSDIEETAQEESQPLSFDFGETEEESTSEEIDPESIGACASIDTMSFFPEEDNEETKEDISIPEVNTGEENQDAAEESQVFTMEETAPVEESINPVTFDEASPEEAEQEQEISFGFDNQEESVIEENEVPVENNISIEKEETLPAAPVMNAVEEATPVKEAQEYKEDNTGRFGGITVTISRDEIMSMLGNAIDKYFLEEAVKEVIAANMKDIVRNIVPAIAEKYIKEEIERLKNDE